MKEDLLTIIVMTCDAYSDIWNDFFNLKEKFWPDCTYQTFLVTETKQYEREGVSVINGKGDWSTRFRNAVLKANTPYVCTFLDDYFIYKRIDNSVFEELLAFSVEHKVSFFNLDDEMNNILGQPQLDYYAPHIVRIPKHLRYGVDTAGAIWDTEYLLKQLGPDDYSAWEFEKRMCIEAATEVGYDGLILCDDRRTLNITPVPIVVRGKFVPKGVEFFRNLGYEIDRSGRPTMNKKEVFRMNMQYRFSKIKHGRKLIKWLASRFLGYKFVTED